jgi:hypothetical protein
VGSPVPRWQSIRRYAVPERRIGAVLSVQARCAPTAHLGVRPLPRSSEAVSPAWSRQVERRIGAILSVVARPGQCYPQGREASTAQQFLPGYTRLLGVVNWAHRSVYFLACLVFLPCHQDDCRAGSVPHTFTSSAGCLYTLTLFPFAALGPFFPFATCPVVLALLR